jgi:hypothetical protein
VRNKASCSMVQEMVLKYCQLYLKTLDNILAYEILRNCQYRERPEKVEDTNQEVHGVLEKLAW